MHSYFRIRARDLIHGDIIRNDEEEECIVTRIEHYINNTVVYASEISTGNIHTIYLNLKQSFEYEIKCKDPRKSSHPEIHLVNNHRFLYFNPSYNITDICLFDDSINNPMESKDMPILLYDCGYPLGDGPDDLPLRLKIPFGMKPCIISPKGEWQFI